jgi:uncharacterized membrane protein
VAVVFAYAIILVAYVIKFEVVILFVEGAPLGSFTTSNKSLVATFDAAFNSEIFGIIMHPLQYYQS